MAIAVLMLGFNEDFQEHIKMRLQSQRAINLETVHNDDVHSVLDQKEADVILVNLIDNPKTGLDYIDLVKAKQPMAKILTLTINNNFKTSYQVMQHGAYDEIIMPFSWKELIKRIKLAAKQKFKEVGVKKSFWRSVEDHMSAIGFAEYGEHDFAREIINSKTDYSNKKSPNNNNNKES